ncbi:MAG: M48 family metallopeptidase, partial [Planctomycetota bacterium]
LQNEAALSAVIGHEIGHVVARHGNERMSQQLAANVIVALTAVGLEAAEVDPEKRALAVAAIGASATFGVILPYSRRHEYEADRLGATYMAQAGYQPAEAVAFWGRFQEMKGPGAPDFFSTHPSDAKRIAALQERMGVYERQYSAAGAQLGTGEPVPQRYG